MHWQNLLVWAFSISGGIVVMAVAFFFGFIHGRVSAEKILDAEITRVRQEYADKMAVDGYDANESLHAAIRATTIRECEELI